MEEIKKEVKENISKETTKIKNFFFGWINDNYDKAFLAILVIAFIIRFWIFLQTLEQPLWYDAASYLATAKNWGLGLNLNDIWYYRRGFLFPLIGAIFFKLASGEIGIRFFEVLCSTGIVAVSYFLIKEMFNKKLALGVSICMAFSWIILFFTARPLTSIPASFFILLSLLFFWKGYVLKKGNKFIYLFSVFLALACLTRMQYLMFIPIILIYIFTQEKFKIFKNKTLLISALIFLLILVPYFVLSFQHYGNPLTDIASHYLGIGTSDQPVIQRDFSRIHYYFLDLPYILTGANSDLVQYLFSRIILVLFAIGSFFFLSDIFLGIDKIFKNSKVQKELFIILWIVVCFLFLGYMIDYVEQRYVMPVLLFLFLLVVYPLFKAKDFISKKIKIENKTLIILTFIILILLFIPNFLWANDLIQNKKTSYLEVRQAGLWIKQNSNIGDVVITASEPQIAYYSERKTYTQGNNESDFKERISDLKPRFLILSSFENHPDWMLNYPQENQDILIPVKVYQQGDQTVLIIFQFKDA